MLTELRIRNVAIIDTLSLPLVPGFNVLSGETGAGKSIIVGALGLLLGERGGSDLVRTGADRASVEGVFDGVDVPELSAMLDARGIEVDGSLVVMRRELVAGGKARAWINGTPVTTSALSEVGRLLVNLHGQHESQTLLSAEAQRAVVDAYAGAQEPARAVRDAHATLVSLRAEIAAMETRRDAAARRADYLRHLVNEVGEARLQEGEEQRLDEESRRLSHVEDLRALMSELLERLQGGEQSALHALRAARKALTAAERLDPTLGQWQEALDAARVGLEEASRDLSGYEASLESDPERLAKVEARRDVIHRVTRKYGGTVAAAIATLQEARAELDVLDTAGTDLSALGSRAAEAERALGEAAVTLTRLRQAGARRLTAAVDDLLPALGLPDGHLNVVLTPRASIAAVGAEDVEFHVALNVGHEARPLARVASGGELSRVMLALKSILTRLDRVPTLVFDEVDSGIGGAVALQVGDALRALSAHHQVLVITHLPQIAARAHHHIVVAKGARRGVTTADLEVATGDARVAELARMLDGNPKSKVSRTHARQLLERAAQ